MDISGIGGEVANDHHAVYDLQFSDSGVATRVNVDYEDIAGIEGARWYVVAVIVFVARHVVLGGLFIVWRLDDSRRDASLDWRPSSARHSLHPEAVDSPSRASKVVPPTSLNKTARSALSNRLGRLTVRTHIVRRERVIARERAR